MLKIRDLEKQYQDFSLNCSMEVMPGYVTGLVGENGAGKSTTFKAALGLIRMDGGSVEMFGKDIRDLTEEDKQKIGVVLSDSGFSSQLTVHNIIRILKRMYTKFEMDWFLEQCREKNLPLDKKIKEFSNGMKAKLKLLVAMSHHASLLILDEPTLGLDVMVRDEMLGMLRSYMEEDEGHSILISSHISSDLENLCDDFYMIHEGGIILHEETDVLLSEYALLKVDKEKFGGLDKSYLLKYKEEPYGYSCLTNQRQYYQENYPEIVVEKGNIDDLIMMMIGGREI